MDLTPDEALTWLREHPDTVFYAHSARACPLAVILGDLCGAPVSVTHEDWLQLITSFDPRDTYTARPLAPWMRAWVRHVDVLASVTPISAQRAERLLLLALQEAERGG